MVQGPQRQGYPNIVATPHGQQLGRKSDTQYTHAVVHTEPVTATRARHQSQIDFHQHQVERYGAENVEEHVAKRAQKAERDLGKLPTEGMFSSLVSMHQSSREAEKRRTRESGRGIGYSVLPVSQQ